MELSPTTTRKFPVSANAWLTAVVVALSALRYSWSSLLLPGEMR